MGPRVVADRGAYPALRHDDRPGNRLQHGGLQGRRARRLAGWHKSSLFLKTSLDALERELPSVRRKTLDVLDHLSAANDGKPEVVAGGLQRFFANQ